MYDRCEFTLTVTHNDLRGFNMLNSTLSLNESLGFLQNPTAAEEMFQKSLNMSFIGRISGKIDEPRPIKIEEIEDSIFTTPTKQAERIDFSRLRAEEGSEMKESRVELEEGKYAFIRSFSKEGEQLMSLKGCAMCASLEGNGKCRLELINESILEVFLPNKEGAFDLLLLALNFDTITAKIHFDEVPENNEIQIVAGKFRLIIEFEDHKIAEWGFGKLHKMISQSKGNQFTLSRLLDGGDSFYQQRFQTENYFANNCETGDILLFQDDHFFAKAQRFFTRSNFDHVGMVVRDLNYGVLIFEANSGRGVSLTPWKYVIKFQWYKTIPKICWRRLRGVEKNRQFNETIEKFITSNLQKHYHISFSKITAQQSIIRPPLQVKPSQEHLVNDPTDTDESGFFCSELVATLYKELQLLTRDKTSANYQPACKFYPKDFSERGRKLDRGELSPQYTLYFDDVLLKQTYNGLISL